MKRILCNFIITFLIFTGSVNATGPMLDIRKEKTISKTYLVNPNAGVQIKNKYGNIYVTTWNEDKIALDIVIKVSGKSEDRVEKKLNSISVDINPLKNMVSARTIFGESPGNNISIEINYTIKIPKKGSIDLDNHYGNIVVDKIYGVSAISCQYGNVTATDLQETDNNINLKYCDKNTFVNLIGGNINAKYSNVNITTSEKIMFTGDYSNLFCKEVNEINCSTNYGDINIRKANTVQVSGKYLVMKFGDIDKNLSIKTDYSSILVDKIAARANNVRIDSRYTNIDMKYDSDYAFDYEFSLKYADLKASGLNHQIRRDGHTSSYFKGFFNKTGANKMTINSDYGNLKLTKI